MRILGHLLRLILFAALVAVIAAGALLAWVTIRAFPQTRGALHVEGLGAQVTVYRSADGVAQIWGETPHDLFMAQGYLHAQERMWQMEVWRHISAGRLAELFGPDQLKTDRFIRTLGWRQAAQRDLDAASPQARAALDAYAAGVNAWLDTHRGSLGLAFVITGVRVSGYRMEPWTPLDSIAWAKVQAWNLGGNIDSEIFRFLADAKLGDPKRTDQLLPAYPADGPVIVPSKTGAAGTQTAAAEPASGVDAPNVGDAAAWSDLAALTREPLRIAGLDGGQGLAGDHGIGSNEWVIAPKLTATGHGLLANDPHLGISMPSIWFMNGLHCEQVSASCPFDVVGVSFPGVPAVVLGHNARIAWGATNANPDTEDLYREQVDPANASNYLYKGQSYQFETRTEAIKVAGAADVTMTVRATRHGPILNDVDPRLRDNPTLLALQWTGIIGVDQTFDAIFAVNTARSFDDFRAALRLYGSPAQNFIYADVDGHIGYQLPGAIPIRANAAETGARPVSGTDGNHEWTGRIAFDDLPFLRDPPAGIIVTANNAIVDKGYPHLISREWDPGYRAARILGLLQSLKQGGISVAESEALQLDTLVPRAALIIPGLRDAKPTTQDGQTILAHILDWDQGCNGGSLGCAAYMTTEYRLLRGLFDDDLGPALARDYVGTSMSWQALIGLLKAPADPFWDDISTTGTHETASSIIAAALDSAGRDLRGAFGEATNWTWGRLHTATFREDTFGASGIAPLAWYFNSGPYPVSGAAGAILNTSWRARRAYPDPADPAYKPADLLGTFEVTNLPSYRQVFDMGDLDAARIVQTTGNSGNPFDAHYGDLVDDWLSGRLVPIPFSERVVADSASATLTLGP